MDRLLCGGFVRNRVYLIHGNPGAGKTTLALQFALAGVRAGERVLYVAMSESAQEIAAVARSHRWSLEGLTMVHGLANGQRLTQSVQQTILHPAEVELPEVAEAILAKVDEVDPARVVIDSLTDLRLLARDERWYRSQLLAMRDDFVERRCTVLMLSESRSNESDYPTQSIASGVIELEQFPLEFGSDRRRLRIAKMRGLAYPGGYHDLKIRTGGLEVYPRLVAAEHRGHYEPAVLSTGLPRFDALLGGGLDQGASTLLVGPAGSGKTIVAIQCVVAAARRGERSAVYLFDELLQTLLERTAKMGLPLAEFVKQGLVVVQQVDPAELTPGQFAHMIREAVSNDGVKMVVIDSLNGYLQAMPEERFLLLHLHEILSYTGQQGVNSILVAAQHGLFGTRMLPIDISPLVDMVVLFRHFELAGRMRQALSVYKRRGGHHERSVRELRISGHGIEIGEPLEEIPAQAAPRPAPVDIWKDEQR